MRVLTVIAHQNPKSFCHSVLGRFSEGLGDAGHSADVLDLHAVGFDPVFRQEDLAYWIHEDMPAHILERMDPGQRVLDGARGPLRRFLASRALRGKDNREIARLIREHGPRDIAEHWSRVERADGLAFIAPVFWLGYPAILKGWFERVFTYGNAFALTPEGWEGKVSGRIGLLHHRKAVIITPTLFSREDYEAEWQEPMTRIVDDWGLRYPGVREVEHTYFYRAAVADEETLRGYLQRAYELGRDFEPAGSSTTA